MVMVHDDTSTKIDGIQDNKRDAFIRTFTGVEMHPFNTDISEINIYDIAHHLSLICRFSGAPKYHYSVAQHSWLVASIVPDHAKPWALMHDSPETYINDIVSPIKHNMPGIKRMEGKIQSVIIDKFSIPFDPEISWWVHEADKFIYHVETKALFDYPRISGVSRDNNEFIRKKLPHPKISKLSPSSVERTFLNRFTEYFDVK